MERDDEGDRFVQGQLSYVAHGRAGDHGADCDRQVTVGAQCGDMDAGELSVSVALPKDGRDDAELVEVADLLGRDHPEISWGDHFFSCAPDGQVPRNRQPYATIITKNYPDDTESRLDHAGRWRLTIHVGATTFTDLVGCPPEEMGGSGADYSTTDSFLPHPLYGAYGWVCVVDPADAATERALEVLRAAHQADRRRVERRQSRGDAPRNE